MSCTRQTSGGTQKHRALNVDFGTWTRGYCPSALSVRADLGEGCLEHDTVIEALPHPTGPRKGGARQIPKTVLIHSTIPLTTITMIFGGSCNIEPYIEIIGSLQKKMVLVVEGKDYKAIGLPSQSIRSPMRFGWAIERMAVSINSSWCCRYYKSRAI